MMRYVLLVYVLFSSLHLAAATELGIESTQFTINGKPVFLLGISCYGALGASDVFIQKDLDAIQHDGFNWIRVWATWAAFGNNVSAVNSDGSPREPYLGRLRKLVADCDRRGIVVDVTLSRENGVTGPPRLLRLEEHRRAVETLIEALQPYQNWYLDLGNERSIKDARFVSYDALKQLRERTKELDPKRLITASHSSRDEDFISEIDEYLKTVRVDFVSPHRFRYQATPDHTESMTRRYFARMEELGKTIPIHYQEPFRRGFGDWEPAAEDFFRDLRGAIAAGAAGWCFHNGPQGAGPEKVPRRSFDLREKRLYEQLDEVERTVVNRVKTVMAEALKGRKEKE